VSRVIDASVALKWFVEEVDSARARELVAADEPLIAPDLIVAEACNAAWRLARRGEIVPAQAGVIAADLPGAFAELVPLSQLGVAATALAQELDHPVYDCFYLALAIARDTVMVTADDRLIGRLRGSPHAARAVTLQDLAGADG
jgi:predicted nucleic acid-binding protein